MKKRKPSNLFISIVAIVLLLVVVSMKKKTSSDNQSNQDKAPAMEWHQGHGTDLGEHVHEGMQTSEGGFIGIGQTDESHERGYDILVVKTDAKGNLEWQRIIGNPGKSEVGLCVVEVPGGFVIGGGLWSNGKQKRYLSALAKNGETIWEKSYEGPGHDAIRSIDIQEDGSLVTTGYLGAQRGGFIFISENSEGFLMKTDQMGSVIWDKKISPPQGTKVRVDHDLKGYVVATTAWVSGEDHQDVWLYKFDDHGNEYWNSHFGGEEWDQCYDFDLTSDGGYICGGHSRSYGVNWDFYLLKVGPDGNEQWHRTFGQPRGYDPRWIHDEAYGVRQTPDGGYVIVGGTGDEYPYSETGSSLGPSDIWQVYLVKTDKDGHKRWEGVYGSTKAHDAGEYLGLTADGGFIVLVDADSAGDMEPNNFGFMKIGGEEGHRR
jgi:hypothetical protein